jgi:conjugal transfer pilin signal peptidase TrbI
LLSANELGVRANGFVRLFVTHLRIHWLTYLALWALWSVTSTNYRLGINETPSLPQSIFIIHKNEVPHKGDYIAFIVPPAAKKNFTNPDAILAKILVGVEGDRITVKDRIVHVNGVAVGFAKPKSRKGEPLEPISEVVVGAGQFYVMGLHKDSLDSRYSMIGLVPQASIVGRAFPII